MNEKGANQAVDFFRMRISPWGLLTAAGVVAAVGSFAGYFGRYAWWLDLGAHFRVQYIAAFALLCLFYAAGRRWKTSALCLGVALLNSAEVLSVVWPHGDPQPAVAAPCRAMLANVNTRQGNPDRVMAAIRKFEPDVLLLEEINDEWVRRLAPALDAYPHRLVETREDNFGIGLFAKSPWNAGRVVMLGSAGVPSIRAELTLPGGPVTLLGTHPLPPGNAECSAFRNDQLEAIARFANAEKNPLLVLGDLNVTPWSCHFRDLLRATGLKNGSRG